MRMPALNLRQTSTMDPPPGTTAHPADVSSIPLDLIITASIFLVLTTSAIGARIFTKAFDLRHVQAEDYAIIFAGAGFASWIGVLLAAAHLGLGAHRWNVSEHSSDQILLYTTVLATLYAPVMFSAKLSVLIQIDRIFSGMQKRFMYWTVRVLIIFIALSYTAIFFSRIFVCSPRGKCLSRSASIIAPGAVNIASDVAIFLLPLYEVSKLQLPMKRKLGVAGVFGVGALACGVSAVSFYHSWNLNRNPDWTKAIKTVTLWVLAELACIILVACFPTFPRLVAYFRGQTTKRTSYPLSKTRWISANASHGTLSGVSSKTQIFYPARSDSAMSKEESMHSVNRVESTESIALPDRVPAPVKPAVLAFEPYERPLSHISNESYQTATIASILEDETPVSPVSVATTNYSVPQLHDATELSVTPVRFPSLRYASIRKTVDVRISNHTNPGSPIRFGNPEASW